MSDLPYNGGCHLKVQETFGGLVRINTVTLSIANTAKSCSSAKNRSTPWRTRGTAIHHQFDRINVRRIVGSEEKHGQGVGGSNPLSPTIIVRPIQQPRESFEPGARDAPGDWTDVRIACLIGRRHHRDVLHLTSRNRECESCCGLVRFRWTRSVGQLAGRKPYGRCSRRL